MKKLSCLKLSDTPLQQSDCCTSLCIPWKCWVFKMPCECHFFYPIVKDISWSCDLDFLGHMIHDVKYFYLILLIYHPVGLGSRLCQLRLCKEIRPYHPTSVLGMTLNSWSFGKYGVNAITPRSTWTCICSTC